MSHDEAILIHPDNLLLFKKRLCVSSDVYTGSFADSAMFGIPLIKSSNVPKTVKTDEYYSLPDYQLIDEEHRLKDGFCSYGVEDLPYMLYARRVTNIIPIFIWRRGGGYKTVRLTSTGSTTLQR